MKQRCIFLWNSVAFSMIQWMLAWLLHWLISFPASGNQVAKSFSAVSKPRLDFWKFLVNMLKPRMQDFNHDLTRIGDECNCLMVRTFFNTTLLGNWDEDCPFPVLWPLLGLTDLLTCWMQHFGGINLGLGCCKFPNFIFSDASTAPQIGSEHPTQMTGCTRVTWLVPVTSFPSYPPLTVT